jgi:SAM-dependent methyltransferase
MNNTSEPSETSGNENLNGTRVIRLSSPRLLADAVRSGRRASDHAFDRFLLPEFQAASQQYWTPLAVAKRAAQWLAELGVRRVFDVGSGAGKFCVAAALACDAQFVGVEQRPRLVAAARELALVFGVSDRVKFVHGRFDRLSPSTDAYYFYNSFGENLFDAENRLDEDVELSAGRYRDDVVAAERMLREAPTGTHLLTYNGFGGMVPDSYSEVRVDRELPCVLRMWRKEDMRQRSLFTVTPAAESLRESSSPMLASE